MKNRLDKLHIYLCIVAAFVVTVICIATNESLYRLSVWVCSTIVVFYVLGQIIRIYLSAKVFPKKDENAAQEADLSEAEALDVIVPGENNLTEDEAYEDAGS